MLQRREEFTVLEGPAAELEKELLEMIVKVCKVEDPIPEDISADDPLLGPDSALGLDSLDAVEIVVAVEARYKARIGADENSRRVFRSLRTLADHIRSERRNIQV
jgi:acyl carrier protein